MVIEKIVAIKAGTDEYIPVYIEGEKMKNHSR